MKDGEAPSLDPGLQEKGGLTRREWIMGALSVLTAAVLPLRSSPARASEYLLPKETEQAMRTSPLIYVSPLRSNGQESRCHGEVWFFEDEGDAVIFTARDRWKATAVRDGLDQARIWVGDVGPVGRSGGRFRQEPSFKASASLDTSSETFSHLMTSFAKRYPDEWGKWAPRFQKGWDQGTRVMIRYRPIAS
ncbi:MAG: hypothetical protein CBC48_09130 [bacterium TMED88]|nr:hypothetical protein [Deltaproteobacteria bacterium]OUV31832.1 MAG: hypothetical protein CBC48_09130 [bacterium TMED88]